MLQLLVFEPWFQNVLSEFDIVWSEEMLDIGAR